jgi:hypothetical protein
VVLRCDDDSIAVPEPRAQVLPHAVSAVKASVKAPSAKVPSVKAPSAKAPSAASEGLGGMFGIFGGACDGACDVDDISDNGFDIMPHDDYAGREWDAAEGRYVFPTHHASDPDDFSGHSTAPPSQAAKHRSMPFGLDGNEYEHPGVIVNQYGQLYDPRVPYYNTSGAHRPGHTEQSRHGRARTSYVPAGSVYTQPSSHHRATVGYTPAPAPARNATPPRVVQVPQTPIVESTRVVTGADGRPYLEITERRVNNPAPDYVPAPQGPLPAVPQVVPQVRFDPHARPQTKLRSYDSPYQGQQIYEDPSSGIQYVVRGEAAQQLPTQQLTAQQLPVQQLPVQQLPVQQLPVQQLPVQQLPVQQSPIQQQQHRRYRSHRDSQPRRGQRSETPSEYSVQEQQTIDPEYQRFLIFQMSDFIEATLDVGYRFVADAVPHIPQLKTTPINKLDLEELQKLKRNLKNILDRGAWPNGERLRIAVNSRGRDFEARRQNSPPRRTASDRAQAGRTAAYYDAVEDTSWIKKYYKPASKVGDKPDLDGSKDPKGSAHSSQRNKDSKQSQAGSKKSNNDTSSDPWAANNGGDAQGAEANNDWANNNGGGQDNQGATGNDWGNSNDNPPDDQSSNSTTFFDKPDDQNKANDSWDTPNANNGDKSWDTPNAGDGAGPGKSPPPPAPSSHRSKSSASTNPHAYVQPYFQAWRGNGQTPTAKALHRQPREPYSYLAAPTPHVPASQVGDRSHGVRAGKGADYMHKVRRPKYLDTMEDPYAVFVFNYRSADKLEEILHQDIKGDLSLVAEEVGRGVLMNLPREKLVEELLKSQAKAPDVVVADVSKGNGKSEPKAKSVKSASRGQQNTSGWNDSPAPAAQPAASQAGGFQADTGGSVKQGKPAAGDGWAQEGVGATAPGGAWGAAEAKPVGGW